MTDFNGGYSLTLEEVSYTIVLSSISYTTITVTDVQQLEGVEIMDEAITDSDAAILNVQKNQLTRSFNPERGCEKAKRLCQVVASLLIKATSLIKNNVTLGYNLVLNYNNSYQFFNQVESNNYLKDLNLSKSELFQDESRVGVLGKNSITWSTLAASLSYSV